MNRFRDPGANHQKNTLAKNAAFIALTMIPNHPKKLLPFSKWSLAASQQNQTKNKFKSNPNILILIGRVLLTLPLRTLRG
jgi:hypothetical protein